MSEQIYRKASKGRAPNALFVEAAVERLPTELDGIAKEVRIQFPWGSLLRAVMQGDPDVLFQVSRICRPGAFVKVIVSLDPDRDHSQIARFELPTIDLHYIDRVLSSRYNEAGFRITESGYVSEEHYSGLKSSWAKRLQRNGSSSSIYWVAQKVR
jgi:16S rRNA (adenine(1408)-N(1))-methyltransferase